MLRIVCRNGFSHDLADLLLENLREAVTNCRGRRTATQSGATGFRH